MDSRSLADERVIDASRNFVCIRLATYEDRAEAEFLKKVFTPRSGELENTTFAILSSDGKEKLSRAGRSPDHIFGRPEKMAKQLEELSRNYGATTSDPVRYLPYMKSVRLALNVASADQLPVAVISYQSDGELSKLEEKLIELVSKEPLIGQFVIVKSSNAADLKPIDIDEPESGIYLIKPGKYGLDGELLRALGTGTRTTEIGNAMKAVVKTMPRSPKNHRSHVHQGIRLGIEWKSEIPETDPQAVRARMRMRGER